MLSIDDTSVNKNNNKAPAVKENVVYNGKKLNN